MTDPKAALHDAVLLMRQGQHAQSLQKLLWFHDHALEHNVALGGVRLSFALSYWMELAKVYPEAMQALIAVRDKKATALAGGEGAFELFQDVAAINRTLGEQAKTVALFKWLLQTAPELAQHCFSIAQADLVEQSEYEVCSRCIPDPLAHIEQARMLRQISLELADENPALGASPLRGYAEQRFAGEVCRMIAILVGAGRRQEAERVRDLALTVSDDDDFREALDQALRPWGR
jgi:hypothetical protein